MSKQPTNKRNLRRSIACLRAGDTLRAPHYGLRLYAWVLGNRHRARNPVKTGPDLDRGHKSDQASYGRAYRIAPPGRRPNPKLPAQQARYKRQTANSDVPHTVRHAIDSQQAQAARRRA